ncbi:hypothetical protein ACHQM5_018116 [Ranunculus cassubicifolius]
MKSSSSDVPVMFQRHDMGSEAWRIPTGSALYNASTDASLFSTSLPVHLHRKLTFADPEHGGQSGHDVPPGFQKLGQRMEDQGYFDNVRANFVGSTLPGNEDELLAGVMDDFDLSGLPSQLEDLEEDDIFGSGGGLEMDFDSRESLTSAMSKASLSDGAVGNGSNESGLPNGVAAGAGEHPFGEHPSRTLFVRNINSNIEDSELRTLFEQYGDIRTLYTACKQRGFVMISYYDIRAARTAMRALQNKPLRRRKLDIHFSIPKQDNPSDKDINQGTLVVFNLDPSVSNEEIRLIFGAYGEVKEIRETPHKRNHKFIEFYDIRAAEAALRSLNRSDIAGKRIKLEPSRPGGARRTFIQQLGQELEQDDTRSLQHQVGSPIMNSPPSSWVQFSSSMDHSCSPTFGSSDTRTNNQLPGLASILPPFMSTAAKIAPIGKDPGRINKVDHVFGNTNPTFQHSHSFPESPLSTLPGPGTLSGSQFLWGNSPPYSEHSNSSSWSTPSAGHLLSSNEQKLSLPYSTRNGSFFGLSHHQQPHAHQPHHIGSAPPGVAFDRNLSFLPDSPETSLLNSLTYSSMVMRQNERNFMMNTSAINGGLAFPPRLSPMFLNGDQYTGGLRTNRIEGFAERARSRRVENNGDNVDVKKQFQLDLDKIVSGEDTRTTLMIKNIPNKYTSKMLLAVIDESHRGTYDFIYLPIDFKNKCNVGYAFINMVSPSHIISFYQAFEGKKWEKFNSEKVASLAYARIQGKTALVTHFQNSSLMNEDKRCRPILFHVDGVEPSDQGAFAANMNIRVCQLDGSYAGYHSESPT